jgi:hypothetical protein
VLCAPRSKLDHFVNLFVNLSATKWTRQGNRVRAGPFVLVDQRLAQLTPDFLGRKRREFAGASSSTLSMSFPDKRGQSPPGSNCVRSPRNYSPWPTRSRSESPPRSARSHSGPSSARIVGAIVYSQCRRREQYVLRYWILCNRNRILWFLYFV